MLVGSDPHIRGVKKRSIAAAAAATATATAAAAAAVSTPSKISHHSTGVTSNYLHQNQGRKSPSNLKPIMDDDKQYLLAKDHEASNVPYSPRRSKYRSLPTILNMIMFVGGVATWAHVNVLVKSLYCNPCPEGARFEEDCRPTSISLCGGYLLTFCQCCTTAKSPSSPIGIWGDRPAIRPTRCGSDYPLREMASWKYRTSTQRTCQNLSQHHTTQIPIRCTESPCSINSIVSTS